MSELLQTDNAQDWARSFIKTMHRNKWSLDDIDEGLMIAWFANAIETAKDIKDRKTRASDWISVDERLPLAYQNVLVYGPVSEPVMAYCVPVYGQWYEYDWGLFYCDTEFHGATHWMPLPEPPEEDE